MSRKFWSAYIGWNLGLAVSAVYFLVLSAELDETLVWISVLNVWVMLVSFSVGICLAIGTIERSKGGE